MVLFTAWLKLDQPTKFLKSNFETCRTYLVTESSLKLVDLPP